MRAWVAAGVVVATYLLFLAVGHGMLRTPPRPLATTPSAALDVGGKRPIAQRTVEGRATRATARSAAPLGSRVDPTTLGLPANWAVLQKDSGRALPANAYVLVLSNEEFVDGALVMGASLANVSHGIAQGCVALCLVATAGRLSRDSLDRLQRVFTVVVEVPSLAVRAPNAFFKDTFDKSYIFRLTCFAKVVFMDADMLAVRDPDALFEKDYGPDSHWVGAIGFRDGDHGDYFQTGMMVIRPNAGVFSDIMKEFESNVPPKGNKYNSGMNGRDGVLLRSVFGSRFKSIDNKYSRNLNPRYPIPKNVVCLHLRGKHKPWFNWRGPVADAQLGKKEFGFPYLAWWETYEALHYASPEYQDAARDGSASTPGFGGREAGDGVGPLTHVWMMRHTDKEYVQLLSAEDARRRDGVPAGVRLLAGDVGASCSDVCAEAGLQCAAAEFQRTPVQSCARMQEVFRCKTCELAVYWRPHPGSDFPGLDVRKRDHVCRWNLMRDTRSLSSCDGRNETTRRFCPCA